MSDHDKVARSLSYQEFTVRNKGYISVDAQHKIHTTRVLLAGCGLGSYIAEALVRVGFTRFVLIDHDRVSAHNLNRQLYTAGDIGRLKVEALRDRLTSVFPDADIETVPEKVTVATAPSFVRACDLVMDTIDFLSLPDIIALHDAARAEGKPLVSCLTAGWGAAGFYFPPDNPCSARDIFGLPAAGSVEGSSYIEQFTKVISALKPHLHERIVSVMAEALTVMEDGTPCPAPQLAAGSMAAAALASTLAVRVVTGQPVAAVPRMFLYDLDHLAVHGTLTLGHTTQA